MEELEERARLYGDSVKQSAAAKALEKRWVRFVLVHGVQYGFKESQGPRVKLVEHFVTYCFCTRDKASAVGREGLGETATSMSCSSATCWPSSCLSRSSTKDGSG